MNTNPFGSLLSKYPVPIRKIQDAADWLRYTYLFVRFFRRDGHAEKGEVGAWGDVQHCRSEQFRTYKIKIVAKPRKLDLDELLLHWLANYL